MNREEWNKATFEEKVTWFKNKILSNSRFAPGFTDFLTQIGFWTSPGSTRFHGNYMGGLLDHVYNLYSLFKEMCTKFGLNMSDDDAFAYAVAHDTCKAGQYTLRDDGMVGFNGAHTANGKHAEYSLKIVAPYITLTIPEQQIVAYHMGVYGTKEFIGQIKGEYTLRDITNCFNNNKLAKLFHFCDDMVAQFVDVKK